VLISLLAHSHPYDQLNSLSAHGLTHDAQTAHHTLYPSALANRMHSFVSGDVLCGHTTLASNSHTRMYTCTYTHLMAVHDRNSLANEYVAEKRHEGKERGPHDLIVEDGKWHIVDLQPICHIAHTRAIVICMSHHTHPMASAHTVRRGSCEACAHLCMRHCDRHHMCISTPPRLGKKKSLTMHTLCRTATALCLRFARFACASLNMCAV
jgi:hypothetical protein